MMASFSLSRVNRAKTLLSKVILIVCAFISVLPTSSATSTYVEYTYTDPTNTGAINHLVTDDVSNKVYIGAVNRLYQLNERLEVEKTVTTGPQMDSPNCPPTGVCECADRSGTDCDKYQKQMTDCYNKALVVDHANNKLVTCSNLFQGSCEKRDLQDVSVSEEPTNEAVVPNDMTSSAYVFIAPGPVELSNSKVLYVGATRSTQGIEVYRDLVPAVCSRRLDNFDYVYKDLYHSSKTIIDNQQREQFRVRYIYGFSSNGFSYYLTIQKASVDSTNYVTRIVRVCQNDIKFSTYTEVPLECNSSQGNDTAPYNMLLAAYMTQPGELLSRNLGIPHIPPLTDSDVLFTVFARSQPDSDVPSPGSAFCVYTLTEIRSRFTETIQNCFKGVGNTGPAHIVLPKACLPTVSY